MIPKSTCYRVYKADTGKLVFASNKKDAHKEYDRLGGIKAGYVLYQSLSDSITPQKQSLGA
jgi:hypothetical protein